MQVSDREGAQWEGVGNPGNLSINQLLKQYLSFNDQLIIQTIN